jgi:hypothetical protein
MTDFIPSVENQTTAAWLKPTKRRDDSRRGTQECVRHMNSARVSKRRNGVR